MLDANHRGDVDASLDALQRIYDEAVCAGGTLSAQPAHEERLHSPLALLAAITTHTPYLALILVELAGAGDAAPDCLARETRRHAALVIRLAHRALEVHARDVGYDLDAWRRARGARGQRRADRRGREDRSDELGAAAAGLADAAAALAAAITAVPTDRMAVPDHLASALGRWLACYARADRAAQDASALALAASAAKQSRRRAAPQTAELAPAGFAAPADPLPPEGATGWALCGVC